MVELNNSGKECFYWPEHLERRKSILLSPTTSARIIIFIKPFDEEVLRSLYVFVKFIESMERKLLISIELTCHQNLHQSFVENEALLKEYGITKEMQYYTELTENCKR